MIKQITKEHWNRLKKPQEANHTANDTDIIYLIDNLYCLCEKSGNIVCFSKKTDIRNIRAIQTFILILYLEHDVDYIIIESIKDKWIYVLKDYKKYADVNYEKRDLYVIKISENIKLLAKNVLI